MYRSFNKNWFAGYRCGSSYIERKIHRRKRHSAGRFALQKLATASSDRDGDGIADVSITALTMPAAIKATTITTEWVTFAMAVWIPDGDGTPDAIDSDDDNDGVDDDNGQLSVGGQCRPGRRGQQQYW